MNIHRSAERGQRRVPMQRGEICTDEAGSERGELIQLRVHQHVRREREQSRQNLAPLCLRRHAHFDLRVQAPRAPERRVERLRPVGRPKHEERLVPRVHSVHFCEEERKQTTLCCCAAAHRVTACTDAIELIQKQDRRRARTRLGKGGAQPALGVARDGRE